MTAAPQLRPIRRADATAASTPSHQGSPWPGRMVRAPVARIVSSVLRAISESAVAAPAMIWAPGIPL
ncbi:hypothetical protein A0130_12630 [Leifsonia xyli]|nr:hypothetical protein A0130_12630 [Leifsonia xyli]